VTGSNTPVGIAGVWDATAESGLEIKHLPPDVVHLWQRSLQGQTVDVAQCYEVLSPEEQKRAQRYLVERPRKDFILTRATLRSLLGRYLGRSPAAISFRYSDFGKPMLDGPEDLRFNISHSDGMALLAFVRGHEIGVDVERIRAANDFKDLAKRFFSSVERENLDRLDGDDFRAAFFRCWTRKEAYIKGKGEGLSLPLHQFDVSIRAKETWALMATRPDAAEASRWMVCDLNFDSRYAAAVAVGMVTAQ